MSVAGIEIPLGISLKLRLPNSCSQLPDGSDSHFPFTHSAIYSTNIHSVSPLWHTMLGTVMKGFWSFLDHIGWFNVSMHNKVLGGVGAKGEGITKKPQ